MFNYPWQEAVIEAAREFNSLDRVTKLDKAEKAVLERMAALSAEGDPQECQALVDALDALQLLREDFSDS